MVFKSEKVRNFVLVLVALTISAGEALQCYECIAVGSGTDECNGDIVAKSGNNNVVECNLQSMRAFHVKLMDNSVLNSIASVFAVDLPQTYRQQETPMSCVKISLKVGSEPVILRSCQTAHTETVKPCQVIHDKIKKSYRNKANVDYCNICSGMKCNGSGMQSATLPLLASILMAHIYRA